MFQLTVAGGMAVREYTMEVYPDVAHGFCVPGLPVYNKDASERHWKELLHLMARAFRTASPTRAPCEPEVASVFTDADDAQIRHDAWPDARIDPECFFQE